MTYISRSPKVICEGAKRLSGGRVWSGKRVFPLPGQGLFLHLEPEKTVSDACIWGQRLLEYRFPPNSKITSSFEHAVSDTFTLIISERAPLEMTYISMYPKVICEENCEGAKQPSGGGSPSAGGNFAF